MVDYTIHWIAPLFSLTLIRWIVTYLVDSAIQQRLKKWNWNKRKEPNREEKSLRHVAMVAKFLDDNKPKVHLKSKFALFKTSSILFNFI